jgi:hypothetical protein
MYEKKSTLLGPYIPVAANFLSKMAPDVRRNVFRSMLQREYVMPQINSVSFLGLFNNTSSCLGHIASSVR